MIGGQDLLRRGNIYFMCGITLETNFPFCLYFVVVVFRQGLAMQPRLTPLKPPGY